MKLLFYFGVLRILVNKIVMRSTSIPSSGVRKEEPTLMEKAKEKLDLIPTSTSCTSANDVLTPFGNSVALRSFEDHPTETLLGNADEKETPTTTDWNGVRSTSRERDENEALRLECHANVTPLTPPIIPRATSDGREIQRKCREEEEETSGQPFPSSPPPPMQKGALLLHAAVDVVNGMERDDRWKKEAAPSSSTVHDESSNRTDDHAHRPLWYGRLSLQREAEEQRKNANAEEETSSESEEDSFCVDPASPLFRPRLSEEWRRKRRSISQPRSSSPGLFSTASHPPHSAKISLPLAGKREEKKDQGLSSSQTSLSHSVPFGVLPSVPGVEHRRHTNGEAHTGGRETPFLPHGVKAPLLLLDDDEDTGEEEMAQHTATPKEKKRETNPNECPLPSGKLNAIEGKGNVTIALHPETRATHVSVREPSTVAVSSSSSSPLIRLDDDDDEEEQMKVRVSQRSGVRSLAERQRVRANDTAPTRGRQDAFAPHRTLSSNVSSAAPTVVRRPPSLSIRASRVGPQATSTGRHTSVPLHAAQPLSDLLFDRNRTSSVASLFLQHKSAALRKGRAASSNGAIPSSPWSPPPLYSQRVALHGSLASFFSPQAYATTKGFRAAVEATFAASNILPPNTFWSLFLSPAPSTRNTRRGSHTNAPATSSSLSSSHMASSAASSCANTVGQSTAPPFSASYFPVEYIGEGSFGVVWKAAAPLSLPTPSDDDMSIVVPSTTTTATSTGSKRNFLQKDPPLSRPSASPVYRPVCIKSCPLFMRTKAHREDAITTLREVAILTLLQLIEEEEAEAAKKTKKHATAETTIPPLLPSSLGNDHGSSGVPSPFNDTHGSGTTIHPPRTLPLYSAFYVPGAAEALPPEVRDAVLWRRECQKKAQAIAADEIRKEEHQRGRKGGGGGGGTAKDDDSGEMSNEGGREGVDGPHGSTQEDEACGHTPTTPSSSSPAGMSFEARVEHILQHRLAAMEQEEEETNGGGEEEASGKRTRVSRGRTSLTRRETRQSRTLAAKHAWFTTSAGEKMSATAARERYTAVKCPSFLSLTTHDVLQCDGTLFMVMEYCHGDVEHLARQSFLPARPFVKREKERESTPATFPFASSNASWNAPTQPLPFVPPPSQASVTPSSPLASGSVTPPLNVTGHQASGGGEGQGEAEGPPPLPLLGPRGTTSCWMPHTEKREMATEDLSSQGGRLRREACSPPPPPLSSPIPLLRGLSPSTVREGGRMKRRRGEKSESPPHPPTAPPLLPARRRRRRRWHRHWYRRPLPLDLLLSIASCVSDTLAGLHALGLIHLDVKPSNILYRIGECPRGEWGSEKETIPHGRVPPHDDEEEKKKKKEEAGSGVPFLSDPSFAPYTFYVSDFGNCQLLPLPSMGAHSSPSTLSLLSAREQQQQQEKKKKLKKTGPKQKELTEKAIQKEEEEEERGALIDPFLEPQEPTACRSPSLSSNAAEDHQMESAVSNAIGTYAYMDGTALEDLRASTATDCFSLGATLFELAFGRRIYGLVHQYRQMRTFRLLPMTPLLPSPPPPRLDAKDGEALVPHTARHSPSRNAVSLSHLPSLPSMTLGLDEEEEEKDREWYAALATFYGLHHHHLWSTEVIDEELIGAVIRYFVEESRASALPSQALPPSISPFPTSSPFASSLGASSSSLASQQWDSFLLSSQSVLYTTTVAPEQRNTVAGVKLWLSKFFHEILYPLLRTNWDQRMTAETCALRLQEKSWKQMWNSSPLVSV